MTEPTFPVTFVNASTHLGKTYSDEGSQRPPHARNLTSIEYPLTCNREGLEIFAKLLTRHSAAGDAYFTGRFRTPLVNESRAGRSDSKFRPQILVVDLDDVPYEGFLSPPVSQQSLIEVAQHVRSLLPEELQNVSCVAHASSSFAIKPGTVSLHLFFLIDAPVMPGQLKHWLTLANFSNHQLDDAVDLQPSGHSLHFPIDRCTAENSRLIYVASPVFASSITKDPFDSPQDRVVLVNGSTDVAFISKEVSRASPAVAEQQVQDKISSLRKNYGLKNRKAKINTVETRKGNYSDVLQNPDPVTVEVAYEREPFVYANINGGDSNAYYWPKDNPKYIFNFKDEPVVEMAKVAPDFYREYLAAMVSEVADEGLRPLIVRDKDADIHVSILYDGNTNKLVEPPRKIRADKDRQDWYIQYGGMAPENYETWKVGFDPQSNEQLDFENRKLNTFVPTDYMLLDPQQRDDLCYGRAMAVLNQEVPNLSALLNHIMGECPICFEHFVNWLAFVFQHRKKTNVAWIFHGVEGTGKGVFFNQVLYPMFGQFASSKKLKDLEDGFDGWREQAILVILDEFRMGDAKEGNRLYDKLKNMISEPFGTIRAMHAEQKNVPLYENFLFFSNTTDALRISATDRRFCVPPAQNVPLNQLFNMREFVDNISCELAPFAQLMTDFNVDVESARLTIASDAKKEMRAASNTWVEDFCEALKQGDFGWFLDNVVETTPGKPELNTLITRAGEVMSQIALEVVGNNTTRTYVTLDQAVLLFNALDGGTATKIGTSKILARHGCNFSKRRVDNGRLRVMPVNWHFDDIDLTEVITTHGTPVQQSEYRTH